MMNLAPGTTLRHHPKSGEPQYRITELLGSGGFGITYLAEELFYTTGSLQRVEQHAKPYPQRVIKELYIPESCERNPASSEITGFNGRQDSGEFWNAMKKRAKQEAEILNKFDRHEGLVYVRDWFEEHNTIYTVLDYISGPELGRLLTGGKPLGWERTTKYMRQVLTTLDFMHAHNVYHFDIKPGNILIEDETDQATLIDFGASLNFSGEGTVNQNVHSRLSDLLKTQGMSNYYCPAEIQDGTFQAAMASGIKGSYKPETVDLYYVAATFYHCATGRVPLLASRIGDLYEPEEYGDEAMKDLVHRAFLVMLQKAMTGKVRNRYTTASEFLLALDEFEKSFSSVIKTRTFLKSADYEAALVELEQLPSDCRDTEEWKSAFEECQFNIKSNKIDKRLEELRQVADEKEKSGDLAGAINALKELGDLMEEEDRLHLQTLEEKHRKMQFDQLIEYGRNEHNSSNYEKAQEFFKQALLIQPGNKRAESWLLKTNDALNSRLLFIEAGKLAVSGDVNAAISKLEAALTADPENLDADKLLQQLNEQQAGESAVEIARKKFNQIRQESVVAGQVNTKTERFQQILTEIGNNTEQVWQNLKADVVKELYNHFRADGDFLFKQKKYEDAVGFYQKALEGNPDSDYCKRKIAECREEIRKAVIVQESAPVVDAGKTKVLNSAPPLQSPAPEARPEPVQEKRSNPEKPVLPTTISAPAEAKGKGKMWIWLAGGLALTGAIISAVVVSNQSSVDLQLADTMAVQNDTLAFDSASVEWDSSATPEKSAETKPAATETTKPAQTTVPANSNGGISCTAVSSVFNAEMNTIYHSNVDGKTKLLQTAGYLAGILNRYRGSECVSALRSNAAYQAHRTFYINRLECIRTNCTGECTEEQIRLANSYTNTIRNF